MKNTFVEKSSSAIAERPCNCCVVSFGQKWKKILRKHIGVARGCSGCTCTPQGGEKYFNRNLQEQFVSAHQVHPRQSNLGHFLLGGGDLEVYLVVLDVC